MTAPRLFRIWTLAVVAAFAVPAQQTAQSASSGLFRIAGTVVNAATGEPVHHAAVAALSEEDSHTVAAVESDSEGHFSLDGLPAAKYQLTASKRGFRTSFYDEHDEFNSAIVTGPGQDTDHLTFRLAPGGTVHGIVIADGGEPVEGARVMLFRKQQDGRTGGRVNRQDAASTDDTGAYEFTGLAAGEYLLAVTAEPWYALHRSVSRTRQQAAAAADPAAELDVAYPVTYYDSTTDEASATHIQLTSGSRVEADIALHPTPALHLVVATPRKEDGSIVRAELRQTIFGTVVGAQSAGFLDASETGTTEFSGVAPGHYELAQGDPPRVVELDANTSEQVDPTLGAPAVAVHGTLLASGAVSSGGARGAVAPYLGECSLSLDPADPGLHQIPIQAPCMHGSFSFAAVPAGRWQLIGEGGGSVLPIGSITTAGKLLRGNLISVQDRPLSMVVTVNQAGTRITGFARREDHGASAGKGVSGVMVVLVPKEMAAMEGMARRDQSDSDGSFSLRNVVPGAYTLVAIEDGWTLDWAQPEVMARYLPGGLAVTVPDNAGGLLPLSGPVPVQSRLP